VLRKDQGRKGIYTGRFPVNVGEDLGRNFSYSFTKPSQSHLDRNKSTSLDQLPNMPDFCCGNTKSVEEDTRNVRLVPGPIPIQGANVTQNRTNHGGDTTTTPVTWHGSEAQTRHRRQRGGSEQNPVPPIAGRNPGDIPLGHVRPSYGGETPTGPDDAGRGGSHNQTIFLEGHEFEVSEVTSLRFRVPESGSGNTGSHDSGNSVFGYTSFIATDEHGVPTARITMYGSQNNPNRTQN
jgi:hypothetical protein